MGSVVIDADILIAFLDPADAQHDRAIEALRPWLGAGNPALLPASVYAEILVQPFQLGLEDTVDIFIDESGLQVAPVDRGVARQAAELRATHASLRLPDALALATAVTHGATLLTLDRRLQRIADGLSW